MIVLDELGRVLLLGVQLPYEVRTVWMPPGGGAEPGEDELETAKRELLEETGLVVERDALGKPIAHTSGVWTSIDGIVFDSYLSYFSVRIAAFEPDPSGFTELEQALFTAFKWWTADELDATTDIVHPIGLADLVRSLLSAGAPPAPITLYWR